LSAAGTTRISNANTAAKAEWEADKSSKPNGYRLKGNAGSKKPIPMNSVKPLADRFNRLKSGHASVGTFLKWFGYQDDNKCWWCGGRGRTISLTQEHLFPHCTRCRDQPKKLWKEMGKATGQRAGICRHVQISELPSVEKCDKAVMDFLVATDIGKFPPKMDGGGRVGGQRAEE